MKLNAVGVVTTNLTKTVAFYTLLGFVFPNFNEDDDHLEPTPSTGSARLMIDTKKLITDISGQEPVPSNHSAFAIEYDSPSEIDTIVQLIEKSDGRVIKTPWDAFWGQRYATVEDPDGYKIDLYATLIK